MEYLSDRARELVSRFNAIVVSDDSVEFEADVVTHNGLFHIDEAMACALLWLALGKDEPIRVRRTRNPALIDKGPLVVDVGMRYDHAASRYDHHQAGFHETLGSRSTKLSAAGLVYRHFGKQILSRFIDEPKEVDCIYEHIYKHVIEYIDCMDNGIEPYEGGVRKVAITGTLHDRVRRLFPGFKATPEAVSEAFIHAMRIAISEFASVVSHEQDNWCKSYPAVQQAVRDRFKFHPSGNVIMVPPGTFLGDHIYQIEREEGIPGEILYYVASAAPTSNNYNLMTVKVEDQVFESRNRLPIEYGGLESDKLRNKSGVPDAVFVHVNGFIAVAESIEGVLKLAGL